MLVRDRRKPGLGDCGVRAALSWRSRRQTEAALSSPRRLAEASTDACAPPSLTARAPPAATTWFRQLAPEFRRGSSGSARAPRPYGMRRPAGTRRACRARRTRRVFIASAAPPRTPNRRSRSTRLPETRDAQRLARKYRSHRPWHGRRPGSRRSCRAGRREESATAQRGRLSPDLIAGENCASQKYDGEAAVSIESGAP